jgi:hypothetical protein
MPQEARLVSGPIGPVGPQGVPGTCSAILRVDAGTFISDGTGTMVINSAAVFSQCSVIFCIGSASSQGAVPYVTSIDNFVSFTVTLTPGDASLYYYIILTYVVG